MKEEEVIKCYTQHLERTFAFTPNKNQFCFIDNGTADNPYADEHERKMYLAAINQI